MHDLQTRPRPLPLTRTISKSQLTGFIDEYELQIAVAEAQEVKSLYCFRLLAELYGESYITIDETMRWMVALDQTVQYDEPYRTMWRQFSINFMTDFLDVMTKADRVAARLIFEELDRSLRPPPVPPIKPGLIRRMFDGLFRKESP